MGIFNAIFNFTKRQQVHTASNLSPAQKKVIKLFYADYPEKPYISPDRNFEQWVEMASLFPHCRVSIENMTRFSDGLLPGHVYMLYWIGKFPNKKVPQYFEYEFGIDFQQEVLFLQSRNYLTDTRTVTPTGEAAIKRHRKIITERQKRTAKNRRSQR